MDMSQILYMKSTNVSESDEGLPTDDMWDDSQLNNAYDKALKMANIEVAKRVAMSTNSQEIEKEEQSKSKTPKSAKSSKKKLWSVGMPCRAIYEGDGLEYEAFVLRIINDNECIVRFLGYDNSEIVSMDSMKPSEGKESQQLQVQMALYEKDSLSAGAAHGTDNEIPSDRPTTPGSTDTFRKKNKSKKKKKDSQVTVNGHGLPVGFHLPQMPPMPNLTKLGNLSSMDMPMPPPPLPFPMSERADGEDQAISSMLLSWYMSGYYTGLYQGLKRSKHNRRHKDH